MIEIGEGLSIAESEFLFEAGPSSGPGGQNVNRVASRVTLRFDVAASPSLTAEQKERVFERLATRVSKAGVLRVVAQKHRTQGANRKAVVERFTALLRDALAEEEPRRPTRVPRAARRRRLEGKRRRAEVKRRRRPPRWEE